MKIHKVSWYLKYLLMTNYYHQKKRTQITQINIYKTITGLSRPLWSPFTLSMAKIATQMTTFI